MPFENEHAARLKDPKGFDPKAFRRTNGGKIFGNIDVPKSIGIIWGKLKGKSKPGDPPITQSLRFASKSWTVTAAKKWLKDHKIKYILFEPATGKKSQEVPMEERRANLGIELRDETGPHADDYPLPTIAGYAAVFDKKSVPMWGMQEVIKPGAFTKTLTKADVRALVDHDPSKIIGRSKARTLKLEERDKGLWAEIVPPDNSVGRDVVTSIKRKDLDGMSFGFRTVTDAWHVEDKKNIRELSEVELIDVSVVAFPAYPQTSVGLRSVEGMNAEAIMNLLIRLDHQLELSDEDRAVAERLMTMLQGNTPEPPLENIVDLADLRKRHEETMRNLRT
jgi:HK97 family phage prohead protease